MGRKTFDKANPAVHQIEIYSDFTGGLNTEESDMTMSDNEFRELVNFDFDFAGSLTKRPGLKRISKIKDQIILAFKKAFPNPEDLLDLKVLDSSNFFDGLNWVFNYVTNKGLGVAILSNSMEVMIDPYTGEILEPEKNFKFYTNVLSNIKISAYSDYWVMITTDYIILPPSEEPTKKQVRIFSWNPIPNLEYTPPGSTTPITIDKMWVEGGLSQEDIINETYYGVQKTTIVKSENPLDKVTRKNISLITEPLESKSIIRLYNFLMKFKAAFRYNKEDVTLDVIWTDPGTATVQKDSIVLATGAFQGIDTSILQMSVRAYGDFLAFCFYQPITTSILTIKVPIINILTLKPQDWKKTVSTKPALRKLTKINSSQDRSRYYLGTDNGMPYDLYLGDILTKDGEDSVIDRYGIGTYSESWTRATVVEPLVPLIDVKEVIQFGLSKTPNEFSDTLNYAQSASPLVWEHNTNQQQENRFMFGWTDNGKTSVVVPYHESLARTQLTNYIGPSGFMLDGSFFWYAIITAKSTLDYFFMRSIPRSSYMYQGYNFLHDGNDTHTESFAKFTTDNKRGVAVNIMKGDGIFPNVIVRKDNPLTLSKMWHNETIINDLQHKYFEQTNCLGFAHSLSNAILTIGTESFYFSQFYFGGLLDTNMVVLDPQDLSNIAELLILNNQEYLLDKVSTQMLWSDYLGTAALEEIDNMYVIQKQGNLISVNLKLSFVDSKGNQQILSSLIRQNVLIDLLEYINTDPSATFKIYEVSNGDITYTLKLGVILNNKEEILFDIKSYPDIPQSEYLYVANTLQFNFVFDYFPNGHINSVIQFKKLLYQKPNLNDLAYLWYNFILFNKYINQTNPNIYDTKNYTKISNSLVEYPVNESILNPIQLYAIIPVNDLILAPGKNQNFQVFLQFALNELAENFLVAVSSMSLSDYTTRQQGPTFDTKTTLDWKPFKDVFPSYVVGDQFVNINLSIPSTTSPYIIVIQAGKADKDKPAEVDVATIVETRIEMSPQSNIIQKVDITSLFDEFTVTNKLQMFETSSSLVSYGRSNKIFFSDIAVPGYFPLSRVIQLKTPESVESAVMFQNKLIVSTENTKWFIGGTSFDSPDVSERHSVKLISSNVGIMSPKSDVPFGDKLYFVGSNGINSLKNLYGTSDKEFTYEQADKKIKSIVPVYDKDACAISFEQKLYINFPSEKIILVYNKNYDSWLMYESPLMSFANFFINEGKLYAVGKEDFEIYNFDKDVMVDGWSEEDGYTLYTAPDGTQHNVQKGRPIMCSLITKDLDQAYVPHRKKYKELMVDATITGSNGTITPTIRVDSDEINYNIAVVENSSSTLQYQEIPKIGIDLIGSPNPNYNPDITPTLSNIIIGKTQVGETKSVFYNVPVRRTGNFISLKLVFDAPSSLVINAFTIRYSLRTPKKHRGGL